MNPLHRNYSALALLSLFVACTDASTEAPAALAAPLFQSFANSEWSEPVHLDAPISSPAHDLAARLSPDQLSIYFGSDRTGGLGAFDIWVSHRACSDCPWGDPVNLGPNINSSTGDGGPALSHDGHLLFFSGGAREGGFGGEDIWVSHRTDPNDDLSWEPPVNLGPEVNTAENEGGPAYVNAGGPTLYFVRAGDIYQVRVTRDGEVEGPVESVTELNTAATENEPTVRADGREIFFRSDRPGGLGVSDIWVATRQSPNDPWSEPEDVAALNTRFADLTPGLSWDGRTLLFSVAQTGRPSLGFQDFWMVTRTPSGH